MIRVRVMPQVLALALLAGATGLTGPRLAGAAESEPRSFGAAISSGADDAEESASGSMSLTGGTLELVAARTNQTVGLRFTGVTIPPGSIVRTAWVSFTAAKTSARPASLVIRAEAVDDAPVFTKQRRNLSDRSTTEAAVSWEPAPWRRGEAGFAQWTPDLAPIIQAVVDRPGWAEGNALALLIAGSGVRVAAAANAGRAPALHIEYAPPATDPDQPDFVTAAEALARPSTVAINGIRSTQLRDGAPAAATTYDLRGMVSRAYSAAITQYPVTFGSTEPPSGLVVVGGEVQGQNPVGWTWQDWEAAPKTGGAFYVSAADAALYSGRAENVFDFVKVQRRVAGARYLVEGCYGRYVRDDAIENDEEASITVRDCLFDGISMGVSIAQEVSNAAAVTAIHDTTFIFEAMPNTTAEDGMGHSRLFKQLGAGTVDFRNVTVCYPEDPMSSPDKLGLWMPGRYRDVTIVLGPQFTLGEERFGAVPSGVTISRDWAICDAARADWLARH